MILGSISKTENIFWNILGSTNWIQSIRKKNIRNFCLFVYFQSYNDRTKYSFFQTVQSRRNKSYLWTSHFCIKCWYHFLALIFLFTLEKISWKSYLRFWKWNLKCTSQFVHHISRKSDLMFCIIFNMILFANA